MATPTNQVQPLELPHFAPTLETLLCEPGLASTVLSCLEQHEARALRAASKLACRAVATHPWDDARPIDSFSFGGGDHIAGVASTGAALARWRACFPHARAVRVAHSNTAPQSAYIQDSDLAALRGVLAVSMQLCYLSVTAAGLAHLCDAQRLYFARLTTAGDAAAHFAGAREVHFDDYAAWRLTPERARHLARVPTVSIDGEAGDDVIAALGGADSGVGRLSISCNRTLAGACFHSFAAAGRLRKLSLVGTGQLVVGALAPLAACLEELVVAVHPSFSEWLTDAHLAPLARLRRLDLINTSAVTGACFALLRRLEHVALTDVYGVTDAALAQLQGARDLAIERCSFFTGSTLGSLPALERLRVVLLNAAGVDEGAKAFLLSCLSGARHWPALQRLSFEESRDGPTPKVGIPQPKSLGAMLRDARGIGGCIHLYRYSYNVKTIWERGPGVVPPSLEAWAAARVPPLRIHTRRGGAWWVTIPVDGQATTAGVSDDDWRGAVICYVPTTPAAAEGTGGGKLQAPATEPSANDDGWSPAAASSERGGGAAGAGADSEAEYGRKRKRPG